MIIAKIKIKTRLAKNLTKSYRILMKSLTIKIRLMKIIFPLNHKKSNQMQVNKKIPNKMNYMIIIIKNLIRKIIKTSMN